VAPTLCVTTTRNWMSTDMPPAFTTKEIVPGSFIVRFTHSEKRGARSRAVDSIVEVHCETPEEATAVAHSRRGHLPAFTVLSVEPEMVTRPMTNAEASQAGQDFIARMHTRRAE
jgi:hypothetical protein